MGRTANTYKTFPWKLEEKRQLKGDVDGSTILKQILKGQDVGILTAFKWLRIQSNCGLL
jgi:hypothetical protein